jgi:hypothetical protein
VFILYSTKFLICYWSEHCMLQPSLWFVTCQNAVCYDQVYDLLLVRMPYVTISNNYIQIDCCVHIVFYQVYDLLLVRTLYITTKFMICYWLEHYVTTKFMICCWSEHYVTTKFMICYWSERCMLRPSWWFVTGLRTLYVTTKFMIC